MLARKCKGAHCLKPAFQPFVVLKYAYDPPDEAKLSPLYAGIDDSAENDGDDVNNTRRRERPRWSIAITQRAGQGERVSSERASERAKKRMAFARVLAVLAT